VLWALAIIGILTAILLGGFALLSWHLPDEPASESFLFLPIVLIAQCAILIAGSWFGLRRRTGERARALGFRLVGKRWILFAAIGVAGIFLGSLVATELLGSGEQVKDDIVGFLDEAGPREFLLLLVIGAGLAPLAEEMFFRGLLFAWLTRWTGAIPSALLTALLFALAHYPAGLLHAVATFGAGLILAALFRLSGSLLPAALAHGLNNALSLSLMWLGLDQ
jgi:membrane protease YdiL (CAAX protease family)